MISALLVIMKLHNRNYLRDYRKSNRKSLTPAEAVLWNYLKRRKLDGRKFRRQHSIGNYIVDFYCAEEKLIIELDGQVHYNPTAEVRDQKRTEYLENLVYEVIRFENKFVFNHLEEVLFEIRDNFKSE